MISRCRCRPPFKLAFREIILTPYMHMRFICFYTEICTIDRAPQLAPGVRISGGSHGEFEVGLVSCDRASK